MPRAVQPYPDSRTLGPGLTLIIDQQIRNPLDNEAKGQNVKLSENCFMVGVAASCFNPELSSVRSNSEVTSREMSRQTECWVAASKATDSDLEDIICNSFY